MAAILPSLPASYAPPAQATGSLAAPLKHELLPAGQGYLTHLQITLKNLSFADHDAFLEAERAKLQSNSPEATDDLGVGDEPESEELLALDPKEWKRQDHYAVLGLSHLRFKANDEQIKIAHRKKVLKHHPDKKVTSTAASGTSTPANSIYAALNTHTNTNDDAFFKCISKAYDVLTNSTRRAQFDSIDPHFDPESGPFACQPACQFELLPPPLDLPPGLPKSVAVPDPKKPPLEYATFYKHFAPIFEREARFSRIQPVPQLGASDATKDEVEGFYDFWYNFDSWRSFEWLDKEVNEGSDNRDDKRYTEKKNKTERARRKKEDIARLRSLVDVTLAQDPRIRRIKQEEKEARAKKKGKSAPTPVSKADLEAEKKKKEEEEKAKAAAEEAARLEAKKAKAAAANAAKKARRAARAAEEGAATNGA